MKALLMALGPKLKGASKSKPPPMGDDENEEESDGEDTGGEDYKALAKDAAKDGDWDACIDALCSYIDKK